MAAIALVLERHLAAPASADSDGKTCASSAWTSSSSTASRSGSRLSTYSSNASTKTENGRFRSSSDADPERTRCAASLGASGELPEQPGLADPGLTDELDRARAPLIELVEDPIERTELLGAPHEVIGKHAHAASLYRRREVLPVAQSRSSVEVRVRFSLFYGCARPPA